MKIGSLFDLAWMPHLNIGAWSSSCWPSHSTRSVVWETAWLLITALCIYLINWDWSQTFFSFFFFLSFAQLICFGFTRFGIAVVVDARHRGRHAILSLIWVVIELCDMIKTKQPERRWQNKKWCSLIKNEWFVEKVGGRWVFFWRACFDFGSCVCREWHGFGLVFALCFIRMRKTNRRRNLFIGLTNFADLSFG